MKRLMTFQLTQVVARVRLRQLIDICNASRVFLVKQSGQRGHH